MSTGTAPFRVHCAQLAPALGDLTGNVALHLAAVEKAREEKADLVVFPELSLTGYWLHDLTAGLALDPYRDLRLAPLRAASEQVDIVAGLVEAGADGQTYNSSVWLSGGSVVHVHRKVYLPTYTLFDEGRYFAHGGGVRAFDTRFGRAGILICEDLWHPALAWLLAQDGADYVVVPSSSPGRGVEGDELESQRAWRLLSEGTARFLTQFVIYVGRAGVEDGHHFSGGSLIYTPFGRMLAELPVLQEATATVLLDPRDLARARAVNPLLRDERPELVQRELARILGAQGAPEK